MGFCCCCCLLLHIWLFHIFTYTHSVYLLFRHHSNHNKHFVTTFSFDVLRFQQQFCFLLVALKAHMTAHFLSLWCFEFYSMQIKCDLWWMFCVNKCRSQCLRENLWFRIQLCKKLIWLAKEINYLSVVRFKFNVSTHWVENAKNELINFLAGQSLPFDVLANIKTNFGLIRRKNDSGIYLLDRPPSEQYWYIYLH